MGGANTATQKTEVKKVETSPLTYIELESVLPLEAPEGKPSVRAITSLSADAFAEHYADYVVQLTPKRRGAKVKHALAVADGTAPRTGTTETA